MFSTGFCTLITCSRVQFRVAREFITHIYHLSLSVDPVVASVGELCCRICITLEDAFSELTSFGWRNAPYQLRVAYLRTRMLSMSSFNGGDNVCARRAFSVFRSRCFWSKSAVVTPVGPILTVFLYFTES